jgi:adenylate cyclase
MFQRLPVALICMGLAVGLLGIVCGSLPVLSAAEENLGLHLLYQLRGPEKPRAGVVIVAIDRASANAFNLSAEAQKWPRALHARLLERLSALHAAVVAFDLIFHDPQPSSNDQAFAAAIRQAGNVVLTQTIDRQTLPFEDHNGGPATSLSIERLVSAIPLLADAAVGQAPFLLPKVPIKLNQYWRFSPGSGNVPTLPVVVLNVFAGQAFQEFLDILKRVDPAAASALPAPAAGRISMRQVVHTIRPLYILFAKDPTLAERMNAELERRRAAPSNAAMARRVKALIGLYGSGTSGYLNLYGPPGTIETISYHRLLEPGYSDPNNRQASLVSGKAVFVGQTQSDWFKAKDGFYTDFTGSSGVDISGVEIAATALANLLEGKSVHPLETAPFAAVLMAWGVVGTLVSVYLSTAYSAIALVFLNGLYVLTAHLQFKTGGVWYPLVVPILVQTPAAFMAGLAWKYREANTERRNIREAFGRYLPDEVVNRLVADIKNLHTGGKVLYSICLFTDAESYTTLSETMDPRSLTDLMNTYYEVIFKPIKRHEGLILQVVGDSVFALWSAPQPQDALKTKACRAAVEITAAVHRFNQEADNHPLPTRIGIHAGEIVLGNIGAMDHFEYRPVGDIVNTASRLEGLNKFLGTSVLVSEQAVARNNDLVVRPVGWFIFKGKSRAVQVHELLPGDSVPEQLQAAICRIFASGLDAFRRQAWDEALGWFEQTLQIDQNDGPSRFYAGLCRQYRRSPPGVDWDGAVHLGHK